VKLEQYHNNITQVNRVCEIQIQCLKFLEKEKEYAKAILQMQFSRKMINKEKHDLMMRCVSFVCEEIE